MARTLTDEDIDLLREVFVDKSEFDNRVRKIVREEVQSETKHLPTKDEFYEETGKIYKRQSDLEEENEILNHRVSVHSDQIEKISKHVNLPLEN